MNAAPLLEMDAALARRGEFVAGPFTLRVAPADRVAIIGPNGAGKSTLLALASGLLRPAEGNVRLAGTSAAELERDALARRVASLAPIASSAFEVSVLELVLHGRWSHLEGLRFASEADIGIARDALARMGLAALAARDVRTLSSGELQRALLAKALAQQAPLILLDEPTASLDIVQRAAVRRLLEVGRAEGLGMVIVTHDLELAAACDLVVLLARGRMIASGLPGTVLAPGPLGEAFEVLIRVEQTPSGELRIDIPPPTD